MPWRAPPSCARHRDVRHTRHVETHGGVGYHVPPGSGVFVTTRVERDALSRSAFQVLQHLSQDVLLTEEGAMYPGTRL
jgi:hypothetical protein